MAAIGAHGRRIMAALEEGRPARRHGDGWRVGVLEAPDSLIDTLARADLVTVAGTALRLTAAGQGFTARISRPDRANRLIVERPVISAESRGGRGGGADEARRRDGTGGNEGGPARPPRSVAVNAGESPLGWLLSRGLLTRRQFDAGERLRADWEMAGLSPRVTMRWDAAPVARGGRGPDAPLDPTLAQIAAKLRFDGAIAAAGPGLADICWRVVCGGEGLEGAERALGWPRRAGKLVLLMALDRVADFYGVR